MILKMIPQLRNSDPDKVRFAKQYLTSLAKNGNRKAIMAIREYLKVAEKNVVNLPSK